MGPAAELVAFYRTPNLRAFAPNRFSIVRARVRTVGKTSDCVAYAVRPDRGIPRETFHEKVRFS